MSDLYDKIRDDVAFRREWAEKLGLGFVIPSKKFSERPLLDEMDGKDENTRCSFHCNCLILGEVARPERFELSAFWFVVEKSGNPKALQVSHLQAAPPSKILPQLVHKLVHKLAHETRINTSGTLVVFSRLQIASKLRTWVRLPGRTMARTRLRMM